MDAVWSVVVLRGMGRRTLRVREEPLVVVDEVDVSFHIFPSGLDAVIHMPFRRDHLAEPVADSIGEVAVDFSPKRIKCAR